MAWSLQAKIFMHCVNDSILKYKQLQHSVLGVKVFAKDTIGGFHNQTILLKIKDIKCDFKTALAWAVSAKILYQVTMDLVQHSLFLVEIQL